VVQFVLFAGAFGAETGTGAITGASLMYAKSPIARNRFIALSSYPYCENKWLNAEDARIAWIRYRAGGSQPETRG
jgi:hypothetical protein